MDEEKKLEFLKKMGYSGSSLRSFTNPHKEVELKKEKEAGDKPVYNVDKGELLALHKLFNT